jgi:hypothetical protein
MSFAPKLSALPAAQRALWPELLRSGVTPAQALGAAQAVYGESFNPMPALKALSYFRDGDLPALPEPVKQALRTAAAAVREIVAPPRRPGGLVPAED